MPAKIVDPIHTDVMASRILIRSIAWVGVAAIPIALISWWVLG